MAVMDSVYVPLALLTLSLLSYYVIPYFTSYSSLRDIPGPIFAAFSNAWLALEARRVRRSFSVDKLHVKYGKWVRVQPNHISIADVDAIHPIYGHGNGFLKSDYYDAFVSTQRGLFSTRDRADHTRKRKVVSHTFSAKSVGQFEQYLQKNLETFVAQWDKLSTEAPKGGYAKVDGLQWCNYLAFDMIADLAFGQPFGMLARGKDTAEVQLTPKSPLTYAPAVYILDKRGELNGALGCIPALIPYAKWIPDPFIKDGLNAIRNVTGIGIARVNARFDAEAGGKDVDRVDLLARLMEGKDDQGNRMERGELVAEALTQLVAGGDTTANSLCGILFWALKKPGVMAKLQQELDAVIPSGIPAYTEVKDLKYLRAVINEGLRMHSTSSIGLARVVPPGPGVEILGRHFRAGTVLSVPTWTIHHSKEVWGPDADQYNPGRWESLTEKQKTGFVPFSYGPRACSGRNVAEMELVLILATMFRMYEFELYQDVLPTREGFLHKPTECWIGLRKRSQIV
jgi:benzoate 4-monooxygenase